jgi:MFS family permease
MSQPATSDADAGLSLGTQLRELDRVYWIANLMEMVERFAYYGLRTVLPIYMVLSVAQGGPEFDHVQKGQIFAWWASVQSFVPIFTGGYADRYGYKLTVAAAIGIKVVGYLVMGFAIPIAALVAGEAVNTPGNPVVFWTFLAGAMCLAFGTAVFKPGLQGIIAVRLSGNNASLGWALFYALVNVGGFLGPYLASAMRLLEWKWVFVSCAVLICVNYGMLLLFAEPDKGDAPKETRSFLRVLWDSFVGILEPRLLAFLVVFSGFWMMFYQIFDLLPNFITDWVDSSSIVNFVVAPLFGLFGGSIPDAWGGMLPAEQIGNVNAGLIAVFAFGVGYLTGKIRSMSAMIVGIVISAVGIAGLALSQDGWWVVMMIAIFSVGEMCASPTKMRYVANIAPPGRKGLYLGYVNATVGIGWTIGSLVSGALYQAGGDKVVLARRYLVEELGRDPAEIAAIAKDDVMVALGSATGETGRAVVDLLWRTYQPGEVWWWFAIVGVISMVGLVVFDQITRRAAPNEATQLVLLTMAVSALTYGVGWSIAFDRPLVLTCLGWGLVFGLPMLGWMALRRWFPGAVPA